MMLRLLSVGCSLALLVHLAAAARVVHVAPIGDDANDGRTLERALRTIQSAVRRLRPGDTCLVHAGVYREMVVFPRSGKPRRPIVLRAAGDGPVTISGCEPIAGWRRYRGDIWVADMPWSLGPGRNQVFYRGGALIEARFPDKPSPGLELPAKGLSKLWPTFGPFSIPDPDKRPMRIVSPLLKDFPRDYWKGAIYYGVHFQGWAAQTGIVESSAPGEITIGPDHTRAWWFPHPYGYGGPEEGRGMLVGHMNALNRPGEWVWRDGKLYLIPLQPGPPRDIEAKRRNLALDLSGRSHIVVQDINVFGASARLADSSFCTIENCHFRYVSHFTHHYSAGQIEKGRDTVRSGETGIYVSGHDNALISCSIRYSAGAGVYVDGYRQTVHNCWIDEVDYCAHYLYPITVGWREDFLNGGHCFTYNTLSNAGRSMINFAGYGVTSRDRAGTFNEATLIAHNHMFNGLLQTRDAGFITGYYTDAACYNETNSEVAYNVLHDCFDIFAMRINKLGLIYLDAGTDHVDVHHNLLWASPGSLQRDMWFNTMCVGVRAWANVFHRNFKRNAAELRAEDFPEGRRFAFGHSFTNPPPRPQWPPWQTHRVEAERFVAASGGVLRAPRSVAGLGDDQWVAFDVPWKRPWQSLLVSYASDNRAVNTDTSYRKRPRHQKPTDPLILEATVHDGSSETIRKQWSFIYGVVEGSWLRFNKVPLGRGYRRFRAVYGNNRQGRRWAEVRLDSPTGPVIARVELKKTESSNRKRAIQIYGEAAAPVSDGATGTHDIFIVFHSTDGEPVGEFEYFRFEGYRGDIPLWNKEAVIEVRVGSPDGEKIGALYPHFTDGRFRETITALEALAPAETRRLYLRVRSTVPGEVARVDWLELQRSSK